MSQVVNLILDKVVEHITLKCQTEIATNDLTRANVVKKGLLQEDKTKQKVLLAITGGDHDDPEYIDGVVSLEKLPNIAFKVPPREIGGGVMFWRRGIVRIECFYIRDKLSEEDAHEKAYEVLGRVMSEIEKAPVNGLVDTYEEKAIKMFCLGNTFFESGGPPNQYIFRGKVFWECLTRRP